MKSCLFSLFIVIAVAPAAFSQAVSDPAKIEVYVTPYYDSKGPKIEVGTFSKGLAATNESEFVATIMQMKKSWKNLRFPEMYVAAIRLYDLGFRNEATYWFYSAQYQSRLFSLLVDQEKMGGMGAPAFELVQAGNAFQQLTGPYINGYAFGDLDRLSQIVGRVQNENKSVSELEKIYPGIAFKPASAWDSDNSGLNQGLTKFLGMLKEQKASLKKQRKENGTEARFSKLASKELPAAP